MTKLNQAKADLKEALKVIKGWQKECVKLEDQLEKEIIAHNTMCRINRDIRIKSENLQKELEDKELTVKALSLLVVKG